MQIRATIPGKVTRYQCTKFCPDFQVTIVIFISKLALSLDMWYCVLVCQLNALRLQLRSEGLHLVRMEILSAGDIALGKRTFEKFYSAGTLKDIDVLTWDEDYQPKMDVKVCNDEMETE